MKRLFIAFALLAACVAALHAQQRTPVILDTDIGDDIDDSWALVMVLKSPELDLKLVTTTYGRADYRAKLVAKLLTAAQRTDVPVGLGAGTLAGVGKLAPWVADYDLASYAGKVRADGVQALIDTIEANPGITVISIGPSDTVAAALAKSPDIAAKAVFVGMQGAVRAGYEPGSPPCPEWNVVCNIPAAQKALLAPWRRTVITPLDTCGVVKLDGERFAKLKASKDPLVQSLLENYRIWSGSQTVAELAQSSTLFDCVAVWLALPGAKPMAKFENLRITVTPAGITAIAPDGAPMTVATGWNDLGGFEDWMMKVLQHATTAPSKPLVGAAPNPAASVAPAAPVPAGITPLPFLVPAAVADLQDSQVPDRVHLDGMLGTRIEANAVNRLLEVSTDRLLEGYRHRPGRQTWDGEHIGKWLHAASLAWANTGDERLRVKIVGAVADLIRCQEADGYLGTYAPATRWTEWDVWAHKYNLIGLITWMRLSGDRSALDACRKMGDLLCREFGEGKRDLNTSGNHAGLASGSVLEPMVWLYRFTGEPRYRDFCQYIFRDWETDTGPHLVSRLLKTGRVDQVGNGKAYEMLSCINGMLEWYRLTGEKDKLTAAVNAWEDIKTKRLYITGTASYHELFHDDFDLPNVANVGETCVTVTWLQLNLHLLRLTGQARYAQEVERTAYNQLAGAQRPDGCAWGYYVQMEGIKPYSSSLDGHCCLSSGPRGVALIPTCALTTDADGVVVNLQDDGRADLRLRDGSPVAVTITTRYPADSRVDIAVQPARAGTFAVKVRIPDWCPAATLALGDQALAIKVGADGYATVRRTWQAGDRLTLTLPPTPRVVVGDHSNQGKAAICYGPLVLAADEALNPAGRKRLKLATTDVAALAITPEPATGLYKDWAYAQVFRIAADGGTALLAPFATAGVGLNAQRTDDQATAGDGNAGRDGSRYQVWMNLAAKGGAGGNLALDGTESRSRAGNLNGAIIDGGLVVTYDGSKKDQDWYMVALPEPAAIKRVVFTHGKTFPDGGWFDASQDKPRVEVRTSPDGPWVTAGVLDYPRTTAIDSAKIKDGARFTCLLTAPQKIVAVRVVGKPACGTAPAQAFSSCAGLAILAE